MKFIKIYGWIVLLVMIGLSFIVNQIAVKGAQSGGSNISKRSTLRSNLNSSDYYWETYPTSLLICLGLGAVIVILGAFISSATKK